jgi:acyl-CoA thioester hydrolase
MQIFDESPVLESEIDRLGHMNVQCYMARAGKANGQLLESVGLTRQLCETHAATFRQVDVYCRFHREQFAGTVLQVLGGLLDLNDHGAKFYLEIRNPAGNQVAATFIIESALVTLAERKLIEFPDNIGAAKAEPMQIPEYGKPRSIKLEPPRADVTLQELQSRVIDLGALGMMSGRFERTVEASECDSDGYFREGGNLMFGGKPPAQDDDDDSFGPPILRTDEGHRFGWAILETRSILLNVPRAGDLVSSIGADISIARKSRCSRRWTFDVTTGELLGINDAVAVALDLDARRAIEIPASVRSVIEQNHLPQYA